MADQAPVPASPQPDGLPGRGRSSSPGRGPSRLVVLLVVLVILVGAGFAIWRATNRQPGVAAPPASPETSTSATIVAPTPASPTSSGTTPAQPTPTASSSTPLPPGCSSPTAPMDDPQRLSIESMKVDSPMLSLGLDESGSAAAPPKDQPRTVGWFDQGPKLGSGQGHAVLTIHTYRNGNALGNELADPNSGLRPGALVRVSDGRGNTVCYTFSRSTKVWVKDYDPNSTVLYDDAGAPEAIIVICWDFNRATAAWDSRILFHLTPLAPSA